MREHRNLPPAARLLVAAAAVALVAGGCSDEPQASKPTRPRATAKTGATGAPAKGKRGKVGRLEVYSKVLDDYRHVFSEKDFKPDLSGDENRDPFHSFVVRMPGVKQNENQGPKPESTELCTEKNSVATNYLLRDLRLIGIVLRGTRSWAVFTDRKQFGHFVHKGDCLGKEKARVEAIGAGFVRLEWAPEAAPGAAAPPPRQEDRQLHPEESPLELLEAGNPEEAPAEGTPVAPGGAAAPQPGATPGGGTAP